ncbi:hypothetical protein, conserved [Angomonas deanei]|uniref:SAM-dependent MTase RsmB/NOP-type domain-containing protein n=1 Tax=Angomonas deanei TaxID=59799 RepID=A0A7G2C843_9TRYP|nr:hypothetical protein, conserved [Angomonas deanei]
MLQETLATAAAQGGGWVLYATHSMNPVEDEAVVCAALTAFDHPSARVRCVALSSRELRGLCTPEEVEVLSFFDVIGQKGLSTWCGIDGGAESMESAAHDPAVVAEVAESSLRVTPFSAPQCDAFYCCLLRVEDGAVPMAAPIPSPEAITLCQPTESGEVVALTPTAHDISARLLQRCKVPCRGVSAGFKERNGQVLLNTAVTSFPVLQAMQRALRLAVCTVAIELLADLLLIKQCTSEQLMKLASAGVEEAADFLAQLEPHVTASSVGVLPLLLQPQLPSLDHDMAVHPVVARELGEVLVACHVWVRSGRSDFTIDLIPPRELPDSEAETRRLHESTVSTRDALLYILRQVGKPVVSFLRDTEEQEEAYPPEPSRAAAAVPEQTDLFEERRESLRHMADLLGEGDHGPVNDWVRDRRWNSHKF